MSLVSFCLARVQYLPDQHHVWLKHYEQHLSLKDKADDILDFSYSQQIIANIACVAKVCCSLLFCATDLKVLKTHYLAT